MNKIDKMVDWFRTQKSRGVGYYPFHRTPFLHGRGKDQDRFAGGHDRLRGTDQPD